MGRPKVLGVLTATVLIAALVVTGRVQAGSGRRLSTHADQGHATAAPSPAGRAELGGVQLVPTPSGLRRQCREAASLLGFAVPCPMLLPASSPGVVPRRFCDPRFLCVPGDGFLFEERRLVVPPDSLGVDGQGRGAWPSPPPRGWRPSRSPALGGGRSPPSRSAGRAATSTNARRRPEHTSVGCCCDGGRRAWSWP